MLFTPYSKRVEPESASSQSIPSALYPSTLGSKFPPATKRALFDAIAYASPKSTLPLKDANQLMPLLL